MTSVQENVETTEQFIQRLDASSRDYIRSEIEGTERDIRRNKRAAIIGLAGIVPISILLLIDIV